MLSDVVLECKSLLMISSRQTKSWQENLGMMNTNSTSENHQAALEQPAGTSAPSNDPKKLAKQRLDKKYREKKKQEMTELKRKVDMLMERNEHLERKCTLNSKEDKSA
ncbi:hypothetical protein OIU85_025217 [Salix viminalis]|uniref:BZIP domain-containing protein n=1 Tax=Salix viminalis TaxID=40686 RepID=A0A9Q0TL20_SALVM|nr:hypothetical protein OIU85_025217 [Salix viminalis]